MIAQNVEKIRIAKGISKTYIADKLDLSLQGYRHMIANETSLSAERLRIIAIVLGVPPATFYDNELTESVIRELNDSLNHKNQKAC